MQEDQRDDAAIPKRAPVRLVVGLVAFGVILFVVVTRSRRWAKRRQSIDDFSVTLLECLASMSDSIDSFQEAVADEGYLTTAKERRSSRRSRGIDRDSDTPRRVSPTETDGSCGNSVRFGDGVRGAVPSVANSLPGAYRAGMGHAGNVGREREVGHRLDYLGIWERSVSSSDDPTLRVDALGCIDTSSRGSRRGRS
jgi:hypothetical protein